MKKRKRRDAMAFDRSVINRVRKAIQKASYDAAKKLVEDFRKNNPWLFFAWQELDSNSLDGECGPIEPNAWDAL